MALAEANKLANQSTTKLIKATDELTKVVEAMKHSVNIHDDLTQEIAEREAALAGLETKFQEESRRRQVEMELDFKERAANKVNEILISQGKVAVVQADYSALLDAHNSLKSEFSDRLAAEASSIRAQETAKANAIVNQARLELQVKEADNKAAITSLQEKNALLATQVEDYKAQLVAERDARIQEARARGNPVVTVQGSK
jgi:hypothetical protein